MKPETKELLRTLKESARGASPAGHNHVLQQLQNPQVLATLDSESDYADAVKFKLRVSQVVEALANNSAPSATDCFLKLTKSEQFMAHDERIMALVRASVSIRPAPPELVAFWNQYSQPEDGFTPTTITVLVENGSPPALKLFEQKMLAPEHEDDDKIAWMRTRVLCHRNDLPLLETCERLLNGDLAEQLKPLLVEVLFDFRPQDWFRPSTKATVPPRAQASNEALEQLLKVGLVALTMVRLNDEQRAVVQLRMQEAEELRAQRNDPA
jgi:hypothetical protein